MLFAFFKNDLRVHIYVFGASKNHRSSMLLKKWNIKIIFLNKTKRYGNAKIFNKVYNKGLKVGNV